MRGRLPQCLGAQDQHAGSTGPGLADELLGYGADVLVEGPPELRERVVARLEGVVAAGEGAA